MVSKYDICGECGHERHWHTGGYREGNCYYHSLGTGEGCDCLCQRFKEIPKKSKLKGGKGK